MKVKRKFLAGILGVLLGVGLVRAQSYPPATGSAPGAPSQVAEEVPAPAGLPNVLSNWVTYRDHTPPVQEGPLACSSPLGWEIFVRSGASVPIGQGIFPNALNAGWAVEGGARGLLYNDTMSGAWVLEGSISNIYNYVRGNSNTVQLHNIQRDPITGLFVFGPTTATLRDLNRTFVNLGLGHEWYIWKPKHGGKNCHCDGFLGNATWSVGVDGGFRYGSAKLQFDDITHRTGVLTGGYGAIYSGLQIPCGCLIMDLGGRLEWGVTHSEALLQTSNTFQDILILLNAGVRY
jgi:hypothetical protein